MGASGSDRWNVLFIMDDQHRADCLGYRGHPCVRTPHLDALAKESVVFTQAFTPSPVCMAARGSVLTGRYPAAVGIRGMGILPPGETTTAEVFRMAGYRTGAMGKLHLTPQLYTRDRLGLDAPCLDWRRFADDAKLQAITDDPMKRDYGFEEHRGCDDALKGNHRRWLAEVAPELAEAQPTFPMPAMGREVQVSPHPTEFHHAGYVQRMTQEFITRHANDNWYAWCGFVGPHHPFEAPAEQIARYDGVAMPEPMTPAMVDDGLIPQPAAKAIGEIHKYTPEYRDAIMRHYLAAISTIDDCVGQVIQTLRDTGQWERTIIVFTADHGEMAFEHGLLRKPSIHFDATLRVPLLIRMPGVKHRVVDGLVELTDLHPTLLGLTGQAINPGVQGIDWSAAILNDQPIGREDIHSEMADLSPMVFGQPAGPYMAVLTLRTTKWKLNLYPTAGSQYGQLFDLENDPDELQNLYADAQHATVRHEMTWRLLQRQVQQADPLPLRLTQW